MRSFLCLATCAALAAASGANAQPNGQGVGQSAWRVIGSKTLDRSATRDTVRLPGLQQYRQLRLCVYEAPLSVRDVTVFFASGTRQDAATRQQFKADSCSQVIDLRGMSRDLTRVVVRYDRIPRGSAAPLVRVVAR